MPEHFMWFALSMACIVWYVAVVWLVAYRGAKDIKEMLSRLRDQQSND
jgi:hypothetical protein